MLHVVHGENIKKGVKASQIRSNIYAFATNRYLEDIGGVRPMLNWYASNGLLDLYEENTVEEFVKSKNEEGDKKQSNETSQGVL